MSESSPDMKLFQRLPIASLKARRSTWKSQNTITEWILIEPGFPDDCCAPSGSTCRITRGDCPAVTVRRLCVKIVGIKAGTSELLQTKSRAYNNQNEHSNAVHTTHLHQVAHHHPEKMPTAPTDPYQLLQYNMIHGKLCCSCLLPEVEETV